eukprot:GHVR01006264.1.p1 GENE.GHVR01006264.1~~GHVR01006264.1.p1  ORF type:complete len:189 (-),score=34.00 GHVR01006264.1:57-623(-)
MGRHILMVLVKERGLQNHHHVVFMNTHLESCWQYKKTRLAQLSNALLSLRTSQSPFFQTPGSDECVCLSILGGDMNLRDSEMKELDSTSMRDVYVDIWEALGKPERCKYSWDMKVNDNYKEANPHKKKREPRLRFDRVYMSTGEKRSKIHTHTWKATHMKLVGTERLDCGVFPSDHFGLLIDFSVVFF